MMNPENICNRKMYSTDFKGVYALDISKEDPIADEIDVSDVSIFKDFAIRNKWIYKRLKDLILTNIQNV